VRAWLVELRTTLALVSVAGYVRTLKVFGNWLQAEQLAEASALRALRKPRVPDKLIEPVPDDTLRRLFALASVRDRAILLLLLDTGLRVSEAGGIRLGDLRPVGSVKVMGKGAKERILPIGTTARGAIVRYLGQCGCAGSGVSASGSVIAVRRPVHRGVRASAAGRSAPGARGPSAPQRRGWARRPPQRRRRHRPRTTRGRSRAAAAELPRSRYEVDVIDEDDNGLIPGQVRDQL
jgi:integrase